MHRQYIAAAVAAVISPTDKVKESETEGMLSEQNEQEEGP